MKSPINTTCCKCGNGSALVRYKPARKERKYYDQEGPDNECLSLTCVNCQYVWYIPTIENQKVGITTLK